jgi:hypothetical protein
LKRCDEVGFYRGEAVRRSKSDQAVKKTIDHFNFFSEGVRTLSSRVGLLKEQHWEGIIEGEEQLIGFRGQDACSRRRSGSEATASFILSPAAT